MLCASGPAGGTFFCAYQSQILAPIAVAEQAEPELWRRDNAFQDSAHRSMTCWFPELGSWSVDRSIQINL